jgi:hypothetical protein
MLRLLEDGVDVVIVADVLPPEHSPQNMGWNRGAMELKSLPSDVFRDFWKR